MRLCLYVIQYISKLWRSIISYFKPANINTSKLMPDTSEDVLEFNHSSITKITEVKDDIDLNNDILRSVEPRDNTVCPICLDVIQHNVFVTVCRHKYHKSCIDQWLTKSDVCPLCRGNISIINKHELTPPDPHIIKNINHYIGINQLHYQIWTYNPPKDQNISYTYNNRQRYQYNPYGLQTSLGYASYP